MADGTSMGKLVIDVEVNDKEARQSLNMLSKMFGDLRKNTGASSANKSMEQIAKTMTKASQSTKNARLEAAKYIETVKKNAKNLSPKIDFSKQGKELDRYQKQLVTARKNMRNVMNSPVPNTNTQLKALATYTLQAEEARKAILKLKQAESERIKQIMERAANEKGIDPTQKNRLVFNFESQEEYNARANKIIDSVKKTGQKAAEAFSKSSTAGLDRKRFAEMFYTPTELKAGQSYSKPYIELQKQIEKAEEKLDNLYTKQELLSNAKTGTERYRKMQTDIKKTELELTELNSKMRDLQNSGRDVNTVNTSMERLSNTAGNVSLIMSKLATAFRAGGLRNIASVFQNGSRNIKGLSEGLSEASKGVEGLSGALGGISSAIPVIGIVIGSIVALSTVALKVSKTISNAFSSLINGIKNIVSTVEKIANKLLSPITNVAKKFMNTLRNTIIRRAVTAIIQDIGTAFKSLDAYSNVIGTNFHNSFKTLQVDLTYLGRSIVAAFEPLINYVSPIIDFLVKKVVDAINIVNQFLSALTGSNTWTKATYGANDFADATSGAAKAQKELNKQLQGFDELNNLTSNNGNGGGSGASGGASGDGWSTEDVSNSAKSMADLFKSAWQKADFTEIGSTIADKISESLNKINWNNIQETARKIGTSLATFLNGFFGEKGFANSVGNSIAGGINTAISLFSGFAGKVDFGNIGTFVGTSIVTAIKNINWEELKTAAGDLGTQLANGINKLLDTGVLKAIGVAVGSLLKTGVEGWYNYVKTFDFKNLGNQIAGSINNFISTMNKVGSDGLSGWQKLAASVQRSMTGLGDTIIKLLDGIDWNTVSEAMLKSAEGVDWVKIISTSVVLLSKIQTAIFNLLTEAVKVASKVPLEISAKVINGEKLENIKNVWNNIKKGTKNIKVNAKIVGDKLLEKVKKLWDYMRYNANRKLNLSFNDNFSKPLKKAWNSIASTINNAISSNKLLSKVVGDHKLPIIKKNGGSFYGGSWHNISQYADGGMPSHGSMFVAGEAGAELVGHVGGRTEVLNQSQLASTMYSAVLSAMQNANGNGQPIQVYLDGKVVFDSTQKYARDYMRRTGNPAFI